MYWLKIQAEQSVHKAAQDICPVVVYDGVCRFCNGTVQWLLKRSGGKTLRFMAWQSSQRSRYMPISKTEESPESLWVLSSGGQSYRGSEAALKLAEILGFPWNMFALPARLFPVPARQWLYHQLAGRRYRLFGKHASCPMPSPEVRKKFIL